MFKLDLSGGNLDRGQTYIAPNGVIVTSSAPTYPASNYYYIGYLFNNTITQSQNEVTTYWLTMSSGNQTLTFDLTSVSGLYVFRKIRVYPYSRNNASSNYRISVSEDGQSWVYVTDWIYNHHDPSYSDYVIPGTFKEHDINVDFIVNYIKFELTRNGSTGCTLSEIELYVESLYVLFKDVDGYKSYKNGMWNLVSTSLPTEEEFKQYGMVESELYLLDRNSEGVSPLDELSDDFDIVILPVVDQITHYIDFVVNPLEKYRYKVELIEPYQKIISNWSDFIVGDVSNYSITVDESMFISEKAHVIEITAENTVGDIAIGRGNLFLYNTPPQIHAEMSGLELKATIKDLETDKFKYRVLLNGKQIIPSDQSQEFTDYYEKDVSLSKLFFSNEVLIGETNRLTIIAVDWYGGTTERTIEFTAEYMCLMFADMNNEFYSTDMGEVLKYLEIGPLMAGTSSLVYPIKLINKYPFDVTNITLWQDNREQHDLIIELSETEVPFVGKDRLNIDKVMKYNDEIVFYVRVSSKPSAMQGGLFDIYAKADPLNQSGG